MTEERQGRINSCRSVFPACFRPEFGRKCGLDFQRWIATLGSFKRQRRLTQRTNLTASVFMRPPQSTVIAVRFRRRPSSVCGLLLAVLLGCAFSAPGAGTNLTVQVLSEFQSAGNGPQYPYGRLVQGTNGDFYGTTYSGGTSNRGTVFKITSSGTLLTLFSFGGTNGANPTYGGLMRASDGNFSGNTYIGGAKKLR